MQKFGIYRFTNEEIFKKRWLYYASFVFILLLPLILILSKGFTIEKTNTKIGFHFGTIIVGLVYLIVFARKLKKKINELVPGIPRILVNGLNTIVPFIIVACLVHCVENSLSGTLTTIWCIIGCIIIGFVLQVIEFAVNKSYLYEYELFKKSKEKLDLEDYEDLLREKREEEKLSNGKI